MSVLPSVVRHSELVNSNRIFPSSRCDPNPLLGKVWWVYNVLNRNKLTGATRITLYLFLVVTVNF